MFRHGCTTINFNWILIRQRWFSSLLNKPEKPVSPFLCRSEWNLDSSFSICLQPGRYPRPESLFSATCLPHLSNQLLFFFKLRRINSIRHYLSQDALKTLIFAFVLSRIDFCNSLLAGCPKQIIHKLQKVQNNAARLICRTPKSDHISPVLHTLHLLPVEQRIEYKLLLLAFKSVNNDGPSYLSDLLKFYIPSRQLHSSSDTRLLRISSFSLKSCWQRKFSYQASVLWNSLPISLHPSNSTSAFKSALKTHLLPFK